MRSSLIFALSLFELGFAANDAFYLPFRKRADCRTATVASGDTCSSMATKCGITPAQFTTYNSNLDCSKLVSDQWVCCSSGTLPSKRPNPNSDGSCFSVDIVDGSSCQVFMTKYDVLESEIEDWNKQTWRWTGCKGLQPGMRICMSTGTPPLPKTNSSIPCGLESLGNKECPLKACCGKWGYCGLTDDFCLENKGGAPGTGCQSNCNLLSDYDGVKGTGTPGGNVFGYYSNWASSRTCVGVPADTVPAVRPRDLNPFAFTHIVYSFAAISRGDWKLQETADNDKEQIAELQELKKKNPNLKTFWAVGGWAFNDPPTQDIFSTMASTKANRATFISNVISQLQSYGFDGLDIDWEYPGIERGGNENDGENFLSLLKEFRVVIGDRRLEISFTTPASFWYLQQFPIVELEKYTNWINLMTYDIHGSWDIKFGTGVLPHTAIPEVNTAVNMFAKAGVPLNKVNLGIGFYGRSFTLADPSCNVAGCPMTGGGTPGPCTEESGFLAYGEINQIIQSRGLKPEYNTTAKTMTLKYGNQWIGYEDPGTIATKLKYVLQRNLPGVLIWAVDLDKDANLLSAVIGEAINLPTSEDDCPADGIWPRTKPGDTATVPCDGSNKDGPKRSRYCSGPDWGEEKKNLCGVGNVMLAAFGHCEL